MTASDPRVGEIQADAIEAAAKAFIEYGTILPAIKAAAPYIAAKALEDAAEAWQVRMDTIGRGSVEAKTFMQVRAAAVRGGS